MKILTILGARPQFIKAAAFSAALAEFNREVSARGNAGRQPDKSLYLEESQEGGGSLLSEESIRQKFLKRHKGSVVVEEKILHTGQHYDFELSEQMFIQLGIPRPYINLGIGSMNHGQMTGEMIIRIEKEITFFENPLVVKSVEIEGYKGIMTEVSAFTAWFMVTHNEWERFVDEGICPSMGHYGWKYATAGNLKKGKKYVTYVCIRPMTPKKAAECLRNTERLYGDEGTGYVLVSQVGDKLLFMYGKSTNKDMWAFRDAIPEVPGFDPQ